MGKQPDRRRRFPALPQKAPVAADPESLFGELPRTAEGVGALWSHQADQLRDYARDHVDSADVALELPTGSGKTLVGLLIADWRRRGGVHRAERAAMEPGLEDQEDRAARRDRPGALGPQWSLALKTRKTCLRLWASGVMGPCRNGAWP